MTPQETPNRLTRRIPECDIRCSVQCAQHSSNWDFTYLLSSRGKSCIPKHTGASCILQVELLSDFHWKHEGNVYEHLLKVYSDIVLGYWTCVEHTLSSEANQSSFSHSIISVLRVSQPYSISYSKLEHKYTRMLEWCFYLAQKWQS